MTPTEIERIARDALIAHLNAHPEERDKIITEAVTNSLKLDGYDAKRAVQQAATHMLREKLEEAVVAELEKPAFAQAIHDAIDEAKPKILEDFTKKAVRAITAAFDSRY